MWHPLIDCTIHVKTGQFSAYGQSGFENCQFVFHDEAENIKQLVLALSKQKET